MKKTYHIIGGGVAGLAAAKELKLLDKEAKVVIYESGDRIGGRCQSYFNQTVQMQIDNATHAILSGNKNAAAFCNDFSKVYFFDLENNSISKSIIKNRHEIGLAIFNQDFVKTPFSMIAKTFMLLFPSFKKNLWFSKGDLFERIVAPMATFADEIKLGHTLREVKTDGKKLSVLDFGNKKVKLAVQDIVISALDAHNFNKIFGGEQFEFSQIINIFYRTSTKLTLPKNLDFLGVKNGILQWVFVYDNLCSAVISDANDIKFDNQALAVEVWKEICQIRGRVAAFLPPYEVIKHKRATIKQDHGNNKKRPQSALGNFENLFIAGDWTMKDLPCSIETAMLSGIRVARTTIGKNK